MKKAHWKNGLVEWTHGNTAYISAVFSWCLDDAYSRAVWYKALGYTVKIGGPALYARRVDFDGIADMGGDYPDAIWQHNHQATFASRGCPVGCWFCIVPKAEGAEFTLLPDFPVRPILCDANLSALPADYQDYIVKRYLEHRIPLLDACQGFEPATFTEDVYNRWKVINQGDWRLGYDESSEGDAVRRMLTILKHLPSRKKRVYVLIGNEPLDTCLGRIRQVIDWGGEPFAMPFVPLNAHTRTPSIRYDWTHQDLINMARWSNRHIYKYADFSEYNQAMARRYHDPMQLNMFGQA